MIVHGNDLLKLFEFDKVREKIAAYCRCKSSVAKAMRLMPMEDRNALTIVLNQVEEYRLILTNRGYFPDIFFDDFENESSLLQMPGSVLSESQFGLIRSASTTVNNVLKFLDERSTSLPFLTILTTGVYSTNEIIELIDNIIDSHSQVKNNASDELADIRSSLSSKRREADRQFRAYIAEFKKKGWLRDNEENFYNNRRVLAVPSEYKREVKGLIHGKSESGRTTFIEPELLVGLNNEISELEQDERNEIRRLLRELTENLRMHSALVKEYHRFLSELDFIRAKAMFSRDINACLPQLNKNSILKLYNAVHPLLYLHNKTVNKPVVSLALELDQDNRILIISGPNAGGKSITLKTAGLLQIMLQSGLLVSAAENSQMCFFNHFLADIGDSQSIEYELSTYSSRLIKMKTFLEFANNRSLILIDEFGTGTDPELGSAIAEVLLEELHSKKAFGVFTTHYTNIKILADQLEGVVNGSMLFDPETLLPKYKLLTGQPGSSYTFEVAEKIGLPQQILIRAKKKVHSEKLKLNTMLSTLHAQKKNIEVEIKELKLKQAQAEEASGRYLNLSHKLEEKLERDNEKRAVLAKLAELGRKFEMLSMEWETAKDKKAVIKKFVGAMTSEKKKRIIENSPQRREKKRLALIQKLSSEIKVGSRVRMLKSKQVGVVEEIRNNIVLIDFGNLKAKVAIENLEPVKKN